MHTNLLNTSILFLVFFFFKNVHLFSTSWEPFFEIHWRHSIELIRWSTELILSGAIMIACHATMSKHKHPFRASALKLVQMESQHQDLICMSAQNHQQIMQSPEVKLQQILRIEHLEMHTLNARTWTESKTWNNVKKTNVQMYTRESSSLLIAQEIRYGLVYKFPYLNKDTCNSSQHSAYSDAVQETYNISLKIGESDMIFTYDELLTFALLPFRVLWFKCNFARTNEERIRLNRIATQSLLNFLCIQNSSK